ncbi:MAG: glycerol-3-phosphate 1-O-acyltransferase PlsY [Candidatus Omnitrophica bacterium]|nr:glycerol-3-phosphate 1-O-acyltransferase PlsY [Candidatus Omnitrophota bacterium]HOX54427.1 glycerol-3-phosphate 1-O-acyltransferase PlsY [Candidatus Omnitrophota bacterium]
MLAALKIILGIIISYLLGSIPSAYIIANIFSKVDIRKHGSGNVGATNVFRVLGKLPGILVLIFDIAKGLLAVVYLPDLLGLPEDIYRALFGLLAVVGHIWTVFLHFKGGKGVATSLGVMFGLAIKITSLRIVLALALSSWVAIFLIGGFVSLASILTVLFVPIYMLIFNQSLEIVLLGIILCIIIVYKHTSNINRLLRGEESRFNILPFKRKRFL